MPDEKSPPPAILHVPRTESECISSKALAETLSVYADEISGMIAKLKEVAEYNEGRRPSDRKKVLLDFEFEFFPKGIDLVSLITEEGKTTFKLTLYCNGDG